MQTARVYEDLIEREIGLVEPLPLDPADAAYPFPPLRPAGRSELLSVASAVLENDYLRATIALSLGGRLISLYDKVNERELLPTPSRLDPVSGGTRGAILPVGIELELHPESRRSALGPIRHQILEPSEPDEPAGVWLEEIVAGSGLSYHAQWAMPPDRAELRLEWRLFHRGLGSEYVVPALRVWGNPHLTVTPGRLSHSEGSARVILGQSRDLWPRELSTYQVRILPSPNPLDQAGFRSAELSAGMAEDRIRFLSPVDRPNVRLLLGTSDGQTLEAPVSLRAGEILDIPIPGIQATQAALRDADGGLVAQGSLLEAAQIAEVQILPVPPDLPDEEEGLLASLEILPLRSGAAAKLAERSMRLGRWEEARTYAEQAVSYNADDHLSWHLMAVATRAIGDESDRPELANAHYLAPMEPLLRAEAFLGQPNSGAKEANPLVAPLVEAPDEFLEVAVRYMELGRLEDAQRWLDEALRHEDLPMARYLLAYAYLLGSRMVVEAAEQVALAGKSSLEAAPWRRLERQAIAALTARFPHDPKLPAVLRRAEDSVRKS